MLFIVFLVNIWERILQSTLTEVLVLIGSLIEYEDGDDDLRAVYLKQVCYYTFQFNCTFVYQSIIATRFVFEFAHAGLHVACRKTLINRKECNRHGVKIGI